MSLPVVTSQKTALIALYQMMSVLRITGNYAELHDYFAEDAVVSFPIKPTTLAWGGTRTGRAAIIETARLIDADIEILGREILSFICEDNTLVVRFFMRVASRGTSGTAAFEGIDYVTFEGGKLKTFTEYFDTDAVLCMLGVT